jgi:hypothetical protein
LELCFHDRAPTPAPWLPSGWLPPGWLRSLATLAVLTFGLLLWSEDADARLGSGSSLAGGGAITALDSESPPFDRIADLDGPVSTSASSAYPGDSLGDLFNRGDLIGAFAAGFIGAGLIGFLFGHGFVMELNSAAAVLGLLFQIALIVMLGRLIWTWWRDDKAGSAAKLSPRQLADAYGRPRHETLPDFEDSAEDGLGHPK